MSKDRVHLENISQSILPENLFFSNIKKILQQRKKTKTVTIIICVLTSVVQSLFMHMLYEFIYIKNGEVTLMSLVF